MAKAKDILDGADMNQDLHQLIGYVWACGAPQDPFDASHMAELAEAFMAKHGQCTAS